MRRGAPAAGATPRAVARAGVVALCACAAVTSGCLAFHRGPMPGEPQGARFAEVNGTRVRYLDVGEGPAVVLLHGFASSLETWDLLVPQLQRRHRVIAVDLKGFGWTDRPAGDYSPPAQAALVLGLLDRRGVRTAAVVAHSYGASVALSMALAAPDRVTRLVLYDAWVYEDQLPTLFLWARARGLGEALFALFYQERPEDKLALAFHDPTRVPQKLIDDVERAFARPGTRAAALAAVRGMRYAEVQDRYRTIERPVLLLWGREDVVTPPAVGERLARDLPRSRLVVYPRCGHLTMLEAAAASSAEVARFLAEEAAVPATPARTHAEGRP
ncbi:MAG: alpha/beta fold hydrolase [Deltaproteobacteria bacterium]|nr:alpha/beta fold hydrolase [Deltaproteobacteria bacterium]